MRIRVAIAAVMGLAGIAVSQRQRSVWDGVFTAEQATRGQTRYAELCASCHGDTLAGGESAPPLAGGEFLSNWNTLTVGDLFDRTRSTMPQNKPGSLNREANAEIMAYLLSANQFPAGKEALPQGSEVLKEIRIEARRSIGKNAREIGWECSRNPT
jgi:mono/diheme cytochrome c family protein